MHAYIVAISRPMEVAGVARIKSQWQWLEQNLRQPNGRETRNKQCSVKGEKLHDGQVAVMCKRCRTLGHAAQDLPTGVYKQTCKILLPVALYDSILVPDLRMSLGQWWILKSLLV